MPTDKSDLYSKGSIVFQLGSKLAASLSIAIEICDSILHMLFRSLSEVDRVFFIVNKVERLNHVYGKIVSRIFCCLTVYSQWNSEK